MSTLLIRGATILTLDADDRVIEDGHVLVRDGVIAAVGAGDVVAEPGVRVIDGRGRLLAPGLVNAHTHSQSSTLSGFGDRLSHPAFMWLTQAHTARRTPDETRLAVLLTAWAALSTGTTALIDHFPGQRFSAVDIEAALSAWHETGMRAVLGLRFFDGEFADIFPAPGVLPPETMAALRRVELLRPQPLGELRELATDAIGRWHGRDGRIGVFPAPSNPDRCSDTALLLCAELAERHDTGIHTHLLETQKQATLARARYGVTMVAHLQALGVLSDRWSCAHSVWLSEADIGLMAQAGAIAVLNPESNARLGVGTASIPAMRDAGMRLALGADGSGANDNQSMHEAMRAAATLHRAAMSGRGDWVSARQALTMATAGGAAALRQARVGAIAPGWAADLVLYRLDHPAWTPLNDPVCQMVFSESGSAVETVIVAGEVLLDGGRPTRFDPAALAQEIRAMAASLRRRNADLFAVATAIAERVP
jgi:cytosine/adenosine deaminase-related metal-dependent hydrolase